MNGRRQKPTVRKSSTNGVLLVMGQLQDESLKLSNLPVVDGEESEGTGSTSVIESGNLAMYPPFGGKNTFDVFLIEGFSVGF